MTTEIYEPINEKYSGKGGHLTERLFLGKEIQGDNSKCIDI